MVSDSYFGFDDDNKIKYKFLQSSRENWLKLRSYAVIIIQPQGKCIRHGANVISCVPEVLCDWIEYYATLWSWWSYNNRNGYVVEVTTRVVTGGAEACLQRLRWWLGQSSWRHTRFIDEIAMHSFLPYTVFNTLRPRQDGCLFADDILKCIFLNGNKLLRANWQ